MKNSFKHFYSLVLMIFVLVLSAACSPTPGTSPDEGSNTDTGGTKEQNVTVAIVEDAETLDPQKTSQLSAHLIFRDLFDRLVYIDENNEPQPWVAESWEITEDNKKITFKIREDITFHNGDQLDANDVKFTFDRLIDPATASPTGGQMTGGLIETIEVIDDFTVEFTFSQPYAPFFVNLYSGYTGILPEDLAGKGEDFGRDPVGSGPFKFKEWQTGSQIVLEKNPDYKWAHGAYDSQEPAKLNQIVYKVIPDEGTRMAALETGEVHISSAPIELADSIKNNESLELVTWEEATNYFALEFNTTIPPFDTPEMRRAIGMAINREEIIGGAWSGYAIENKNPLGVGLFGHSPEIGEEYGTTHDPEESKNILESQGYTMGSDGIYEKDGEKAKFTLLTSNDPKYTRASQIIQSQLKQVGVDLEVQVIDGSAYRSTQEQAKHHLHMQRWNWVDPVILSFVFKEGGIVGLYQNDELDKVLAQADQTLDPEERIKYLEESQKLILEDAATIPLLTEYIVEASRTEVKDYKWDSLGYPLWLNVTIE